LKSTIFDEIPIFVAQNIIFCWSIAHVPMCWCLGRFDRELQG
jgi:hypothetical protein